MAEQISSDPIGCDCSIEAAFASTNQALRIKRCGLQNCFGNKGGEVIDRKFVHGTVHTRIGSDLAAGSKLLLGIPGGPGIQGRYMDQITTSLADRIGAIPMVVDLPNHDSSTRINSGVPMVYSEARTMLIELLHELTASGSTLVLFGHSLGAVIALDLLSSQKVPIEKTILVGMPIEFERNPAFTRFLVESGAPEFADEPGFANWWKAVLPAYFFRKATQQELDLLTNRTFWFANAQFTEGMPSARQIASTLKRELIKSLIYIEGEKEIVIPHDNFKRVADAFPTISKSIISETGHFPMLEKPQDLLNEVSRSPLLQKGYKFLTTKEFNNYNACSLVDPSLRWRLRSRLARVPRPNSELMESSPPHFFIVVKQ